jgi:hypothetical protein
MTARLPLLLSSWVVIAAGVGFLDALFTDEYDFAVVFGLVALIGLAQCASVLVRRTSAIELRRDLARWLVDRSRLTGEPVGRLADRAVSTYRTGLGEDGGDRDPDRPVTGIG